MRTSTPPPRAARSDEAGSAYVIALFVILLLSMLGLSLSLVTGTEAIIGFNDQLIQQTFYGADAGVGVGVSRILVTRDCDELSFILNTDVSGGSPTIAQTEITQESFLLFDAPCNYCQISSSEEEAVFKRVFFQINSTGRRATRRTGTADASTATASRTVSAILDTQPFDSPIECLYSIEDDGKKGECDDTDDDPTNDCD